MATIFSDTFTTPQSGNSFQVYERTWFPASTRTIANSTFAGVNIGSSLLDFTINGISGSCSLIYTFQQPQNLTSLSNITFSSSIQKKVEPAEREVSLFATFEVTVMADSTPIGSGNLLFSPSVDVNGTLAGEYVNSLTFLFNFSSSEVVTSLSLTPFSSSYTCFVGDTFIEMADGSYKAMEEIERGEVVRWGSKTSMVARLIKEKLHPRQRTELIIFQPESLAPGVPRKKTIVCSQHYLVYQGKRYVAKSFIFLPGVSCFSGPAQDIGQEYMYDLQFEEEGFYLANGLLSQSRSPYAQASPLAKELYFTPQKYTEKRVPNTIAVHPPIVHEYLRP